VDFCGQRWRSVNGVDIVVHGVDSEVDTQPNTTGRPRACRKAQLRGLPPRIQGADSVTSGDTAERSLAHWSEEGRAEMEAFYTLATEDYRQLALAADWAELLGARAHEGWQLLDVACGSGKFPTALLKHAGIDALPSIAYDLLDPSAFSVSEARGVLAPPFEPRHDLVMTLQDLPADAGPYDVVWATHALYALPPSELDAAAERFIAAIAPGGLGLVAQVTSRSHYLAFYDAYRAGINDATPYTSAEQVRDALVGAGADVREQLITYETGTADRRVAEGFLQRCAFDDTVSLEQMEQAPVLGDYLASCRQADGSYLFKHEAALLWL
jgi:SAM-dependent methyltransferase